MEDSKVIEGMATPRGQFPHIRRAGDYLFISGTSSRRPDNTIAGAQVDEFGAVTLDIKIQTCAVIENIRAILSSLDANLDDLVELSVFLVNMNDFKEYNEIYSTYFDFNGPTRTTVVVHQLPHPHLLIEIKGIAYRPLKI